MGDERIWVQQEFEFEFDEITQKKKKNINYDLIVAELRKGPLRFTQIQALAGVSKARVAQVITTLSLHYPLYEAARGLYKLYGEEEYGDGINHEALRKLGYEEPRNNKDWEE